jgi:FAD/FMN-containing dehydrogenase
VTGLPETLFRTEFPEIQERPMAMPAVTADGGAELRSALASAVHGAVLTPGDAGYSDARAVHNGAVEHRPAAIVQVASAADARAALALAGERGLRVTVRGGGHGVDGAGMAGDIVLDLRALRGVSVDAQRQTATVRGGATWADLDAATGAHGFVVPGSRVGSVGVVGSTLAGGTGWLTPRYGTTWASVLVVESVSVDGLRTDAATEDEPDGRSVITSLTVTLYPQPAAVLAGRLLYRLADAADVASVVADLVTRRRPEFAPMLRWQPAPAAAYVPGDVVGRPVLAVLPTWTGDAAEGAQFLAPLRRAARALVDATHPTSYTELQQQLDASSPWGRRRAEFAALDARPPAASAALLETALADRPGPHGFVELTPVASSGEWVTRAEAQWTDRADDARHRSWLAALETSLRPSTDTTH